MKRRLFSLIALLFATLMLFTSCGNLMQENEDVRKMTESFLDATIANDAEAAYAVLTEISDKESFSQVFPQIVSLFDGVESYTLKQTGWYTSLDNGVQTTTMTYSVETNEETVFIVKSTVKDGFDDLYLISFNDTKWVTTKGEELMPLNIGLIIVSVAAMAFSIWMLVDCIKRKVSKKPLWIILILLGIKFSLTFTHQNMKFNWATGLFLHLSGVNADIYANTVTISLLIPVGAIVYFIIRKRITKKESAPTVIEGEAKEITTSEETTSDETTST